jgi:hypothetical protein
MDGHPYAKGGGASRSGRVVADAVGAVGGTLKVGLGRSRASSPVWSFLAS